MSTRRITKRAQNVISAVLQHVGDNKNAKKRYPRRARVGADNEEKLGEEGEALPQREATGDLTPSTRAWR